MTNNKSSVITILEGLPVRNRKHKGGIYVSLAPRLVGELVSFSPNKKTNKELVDVMVAWMEERRLSVPYGNGAIKFLIKG